MTRIKLRHDSAANWTSVDPVLLEGEMGIETDTDKFKFGDGTTAWSGLSYAGGAGAVTSVNTQTGAVVLDATDVGADAAGTAAALVDDLSGVTDAATARTNLGLGSAATQASTAFDASGAAAAAQAAAVQRANHTGSQSISTISDAFDATVPTTQAFGDSAVVGTSTTAAHRDHKHAMPAAPVPLALFGDGSDGAVAMDGTNTFGFASTTGAAPNLVYTLTRDVYATTFSVSSGKVLNTAGYRVMATVSATTTGATVQNNGGDASANTAGIAAPGATVGGGGAGGAGLASGTTTNNGGNSANTNANNHSLGGRGGVGGNGNGGTAGTLSTIARMPSFRDYASLGPMSWMLPAAAATSAPTGPFPVTGGTGGSGGGRTTGGTAAVAGGGGGGGGVVWIAAPTITNTGGTIQANGGNGAAASGGTCVTGGGGGGGGGVVVMIYNTLAAGTEQALGGTKGGGINGAAAANDGGTGTVRKLANA